MPTYSIKNRFTDAVQYTCELTAEAAELSASLQLGFAVKSAVANGADLGDADLVAVKQDFLAEVLRLPDELEFLRSAIAEGRIDGSTYDGDCACLAGTLVKSRHPDQKYSGYSIDVAPGVIFHANSYSPREVFFSAIRPGDTPKNNSASAIALAWTDEAIAIRDMIRATARSVDKRQL
jgi:hypothetical protein